MSWIKAFFGFILLLFGLGQVLHYLAWLVSAGIRFAIGLLIGAAGFYLLKSGIDEIRRRRIA